MRGIPDWEPIGNYSGELFQVYETQIRRGTTDFSHVAPASPLPEEKHAWIKDCHALLAGGYFTGNNDIGNIEITMINMCDTYTMIFNWLIGLTKNVIGLMAVEEEEHEVLTAVIEWTKR